MHFERLFQFMFMINMGIIITTKFIHAHSHQNAHVVKQTTYSNSIPTNAIPLPPGTVPVQLGNGTIIIQSLTQQTEPQTPLNANNNNITQVTLPTGAPIPEGAILIRPSTSKNKSYKNKKIHVQKSDASDNDKEIKQYTIPNLPEEVDEAQQVLPEVDHDMSDPTQIIGLQGEEKEVSENSDFIVPTRILIPHIANPPLNSIDKPIQNKILPEEVLNTKDIIPFEPKPDPLELEEAPACPVNFDDEIPENELEKKNNHSKYDRENDDNSDNEKSHNDTNQDESQNDDSNEGSLENNKHTPSSEPEKDSKDEDSDNKESKDKSKKDKNDHSKKKKDKNKHNSKK